MVPVPWKSSGNGKKRVYLSYMVRIRVMVISSTFNNTSVISWRSVLLILVAETGVPGETHRSAASH